MKREAITTVYILPASNSAQAVIIRRGPSKWWHLLVWDRDSGEVTPGSWFNGLLYPHRCDVSPKGDWLLMLAYNGANDPKAWTALCRPPSAKAAVFWPQDNARHGGGFFDGRHPIIWLNYPDGTPEAEIREEHPFDLGLIEPDHESRGYLDEKMERNRWRLDKRASKGKLVWTKEHGKRGASLIGTYEGERETLHRDCQKPDPICISFAWRPKGSTEWNALEETTWADFNGRGEITFVREGRLMAFHPDRPDLLKLVFDLTGLRPRPAVSQKTLLLARLV